MLRSEHNKHFNVNRKPDERVSCNTFGYGELSQYDGDCIDCYLGNRHNWQQHDNNIKYCKSVSLLIQKC